MSSTTLLTQEQIISGRDIPLKELLFAKKVFHNYMLIAKETSPIELLPEMKEAIKRVEYFQTKTDPCEARNLLSALFTEVEIAESFQHFNDLAGKPTQALNELIEDRVQLIKKERHLLAEAGYDVSKI
ncbi:hypothetical protein [Vibrio sp. 10N.261.55.A7]|uniref:hypothetical protein n=1 Tax=Vibrio sp. 10N.261.55.A7 TaxID=1880851 RepID=UPI000C84006B|nr:hypothetical protein [Vibrio sp. 10N.261.55.A7]PMK04265.1 hypothetical protein BCU12_16105 [Vibrio sp. 10N.261.55.A7]